MGWDSVLVGHVRPEVVDAVTVQAPQGSNYAYVTEASLALADMAGVASVIDGDTIEVHGQRIRLHGIDAPESRQLCRLDGKPWQCGKDAANALAVSGGDKLCH